MSLNVGVLNRSSVEIVSNNQKIVHGLKNARKAFEGKRATVSPSELNLPKKWFFAFEQGLQRYIGIHKDQQENLLKHCLKWREYKPFHKLAMKFLQLPLHTPTLQVIGDSAPFSATGTKTAKVFLEAILQKHDGLILWGYTGNIDKSSGAADTNYLVNQWLEADPTRYRKAMANVVDFHTVKAVEEWNCSIPSANQNFYMVYGNAQFGDDVISSDLLTDKAVVLEGGIQSFLQMINLLSFKIKMQCLYNIRGRVAHISGRDKKFFSASEFLCALFQQTLGKTLTKEQVENFKDEYLKSRVLFDAKKPDAPTKQKLFDLAWRKFIKEQLWTRLHLCHFVRAPDTIHSKL